MTYNLFTYNSVLYNSSPSEAGAVIKSIIQAHTGAHIQAVVGGSGGLSFISDFIITEGSVRKPPTAYNFPDLAAQIRGVIRGNQDLGALIVGQIFHDLPASIFPVATSPVLSARIVSLIFTDLSAAILGVLAEKNLPAIIQGTEFRDLAARVAGFDAPNLPAFIGAHSPANLGAIIWSPMDLLASIRGVSFDDLSAAIMGFTFRSLPGKILGISAPQIRGIIKSLFPDTANLPAKTGATATSPDLGASIIADFHGLNALITPSGGYLNLMALLTGTSSTQRDLGATIAQLSPADLGATIGFFSAKNLIGAITAVALGEKDKFLAAFIQPGRNADLAATIMSLQGVKNLGAFIQSTTSTADLGAIITTNETFITTVLNIITLGARDLGATIGNPACGGGSATLSLLAAATAQQAHDLSAKIQSFIVKNLGASINSTKLFYVFDTIDVFFSRRNVRPTRIRATDTITISFSPFRGKTLGASIVALPPQANLGAALNAVFPLPRVAPFTDRIKAVDLRKEIQNIEEVRLQMEGDLIEFLYVNGTQDAFILDANKQWRINVRSFQPIAENLFGDHAASRVCRLGSLRGFFTLDEAVRSCIAFVLGLDGQHDLGATIRATGSFVRLRASISVSDVFSDLRATAGRVFPSDPLGASINPSGQLIDLNALISGSASSSASLGAIIDQMDVATLGASITGV